MSRAGQSREGRWSPSSSSTFLELAVDRGPARRRHEFEALSLEHGLSQSIVQCIHIDRRGFLWCGTEDGLNRYDGYEFKIFRHGVDDPESLSYSEIQCLLEDRQGALWVGTFGGLNRLDLETERCERFLHRGDVPGSLANDSVRVLLEDRHGNLWIGTQGGGLDLLDRKRRLFLHHRHDPRDPTSLGHDDVRALLEDRDGGLWVGTGGGGLDYRCSGSRGFRHFRHDPEDPRSLCSDEVTVLHRDGHGRLFVGTRQGLDLLDEESGNFVHVLTAPERQPYGVVTALGDGEAGELWVGTDGEGLDCILLEEGVAIRYRHDPKRPGSLVGDRLRAVLHDRAGVLWIGSYGVGLSKGSRRKSRFAHFRFDPDDPSSLSHGIVWSIWEDDDGALWIGTDAGLDRVDPKRTAVSHFGEVLGDTPGHGSRQVRVVLGDRSGALWIGTNGGLLLFDRERGVLQSWRHDPRDPESLGNDEIRVLYEDRDGGLWIGSMGGGLARLDVESGRLESFRHRPGDVHSLANDFVRVIHEDAEGALWIGMQGGGLDRFDRRSGLFEHHRHDPEDRHSLSSDYVFSIWEDSDGILWLGTYSGGLDRFDRQRRRVQRFGTSEGLPANLIYGILGDDSGRLWISSNRGLSCFDPRTLRFRNYDRHDGLQDDEFNGGSYFKSSSGELFFGGINGFNAFIPDELRDSSFEPPVVVTDFQLYGRSVRPGKNRAGRTRMIRSAALAKRIRLSYRDRVFSFQFAALDYTNPRQNRYAYRMAGFDREWRETSAGRRFATYTNLPPGKYRFQVRGTNCDGIWSAARASVAVEIEPPFWGTWWFRGLALGTVLGAASRSYRRRVQRVRLQTELDAAREVQRSIWPTRPPVVAGLDIAGTSRPASAVGGDFFDYLWHGSDRERLCVAVGDVSGKGMKAAMRAVMASGMLAATVESDDSLQEVLRRLGRIAYQHTSEHAFIALALASFDPSTGELVWVNAGLPEPLLKSRGEARFLPTADPRYPLGVHADEGYCECRARLEAGDVVVLASDGFVESTSAAGEVYGYVRIARRLTDLATESLSASQILDALVEDVSRFRAGSTKQDDVTAVVVKVTSLGR